MRSGRLSVGDIVVAVGGGLLVLGTLLPWFGPAGDGGFVDVDFDANGLYRFTYFGWITALAGLAALELVQLRLLAPGRFKLPIPDAVICMVLALVSLLVLGVEMIWQPFYEAGNKEVDLQWGIFVTVAAAVVLAVGGFLKLADHAGATAAVPAAAYGAQTYAQTAAVGYAGSPQAPAAPGYAAPPAQPAAAPPAQPFAAPVPDPAASQPSAVPSDALEGPAAAASQPAAADVAASAFCGNCGAAMAADAVFCTSCGTKRG